MQKTKDSEKDKKQEVKEQVDHQDYEQDRTDDKYYDSDIASVNEKDFLSDSQPPKDIPQQRKLLWKEKFLHVYKTILSLGYGMDKPAKYDKIKLTWKQIQIANSSSKSVSLTCEQAVNILKDQPVAFYNLGYQNQQIQRFVTSMRSKEIALFQRDELETSSKSNIKILKQRSVFIIHVEEWTTVIDIDADRKYLKYILKRGQGPNRISEFDEVSYQRTIECNGKSIVKEFKLKKMQRSVIDQIGFMVWKILSSMKKNQLSYVEIGEKEWEQLQDNTCNEIMKQFGFIDPSEERVYRISLQVLQFNKIDNVFLDGRILKKMIMRGVSTAKPDSSSLIYYALTFLSPKDKSIIKKDACFDSDWWEDYSKLDLLGCRKNYLDDYTVSKMLKSVIKRMKPAQIAEVQCRDMTLFTFGDDYNQFQSLLQSRGQHIVDRFTFIIRLYNFTQAKTCFNMELQQKIQESKRRKAVAVNLVSNNQIKKALKRFQNIVSFYSEGKINQQAYNQKISALMNSVLCLMKMQKYSEMIPLCNLVLEKPKHGTSIKDIKITGPNNYSVQNNQNIQEEEENSDKNTSIEGQKKQKEEDIGVEMNINIIDKCLYRKALALSEIGQNEDALKQILKITEKTPQTQSLKQLIEKRLQQYLKKSKQMFKNMFSS